MNNKNISECSFNWIGRIFGKRHLLLDGGSLKVITKKNVTTACSLIGAKNFAILTSNFFGSSIIINIGGHDLEFNYLKSKDAKYILDKINILISEYVEEYAFKHVNEFDSYVVNQYPRDSWLNNITDICNNLSTSYNDKKKLWDKYLSNECLDSINKVIYFHPVDKNTIREYHESEQLKLRESFLDKVESNPLTLEQRLGVLRSNDINLVLAAAGTGKTSVMVAKALDIIDRKLALPSEILILAYNKNAAKELQERLKDKSVKSNISLQTELQISTFHAYGRNILRKAGIPTHISVFTEDDVKLKQWITEWLTRYLLASGSRMLSFIGLFPEPINPFDFSSKADYERYIRDNEFRTINGEKVRGYQELLIANFLAINGVDYLYEPMYVSKKRIDIGFDYRPDFHLVGTDIYIEHFGIDRKGNTRKDIDKNSYNESIEKKRILHNECGTKLIETFHYEWVEDCLESNLSKKLTAQGVEFKCIDLKDIFDKLKEKGHIASWSDLLLKALQAIRIERLNKQKIFERLNKYKISQPQKITDILDALHLAYIDELKNQNSIDFDDMIIRATDAIQKNLYSPNWKYILVDEFQDISGARMEMLNTLIKYGSSPSLTVVGDDWQSIYRFSGGKLELTTRFNELIGNHSLTKLQKTANSSIKCNFVIA